MINKKAFIGIFLILISIYNCSNTKDETKYITHLRDEITKNYNLKEIKIEIVNDETLTILLKNSKFKDYSKKEKQKIALQMGQLALKLRGNETEIETGELIFINDYSDLEEESTKPDSFKMY
ncbi:hypothetical protein [Algibacter agarivorans]